VIADNIGHQNKLLSVIPHPITRPSDVVGSNSPQACRPELNCLISELTSDEEMERNLSEWRRMEGLYECDGMNVCIIKYQNKPNRVASCHKTFRMANCFPMKVVVSYQN
jgi:hypothetical protein